jgi:ABC-type enterobactin transport system permease subunit
MALKIKKGSFKIANSGMILGVIIMPLIFDDAVNWTVSISMFLGGLVASIAIYFMAEDIK